MLGDQFGDLPGRDAAAVDHIVNAVWDLPDQRGHAGGGEFAQVRQAVGGLQQSVVALDLAEIVAGGVEFVERDAKPPDVAVLEARQDLFARARILVPE